MPFKLTENALARTSFIAVAVLSAAVLTGCSPSGTETEARGTADAGAAAEPQQRCFRQEFPFSNEPGKADVMSLVVVIDGDRTHGEYDWLPAEKDRRTGRFEGSVAGDLITATYEYTQEGLAGTTPITIRLGNARAIVAGGDAAAGLAATLPETNCNKN
jgi:hypothetical protein